jgi:hypothetical protein
MQKIVATVIAFGLSLAVALPAHAQYGAKPAPKAATPELPRCASPLGTVAIQEPETEWWKSYGLSNPEKLIKLFASRSNCLRVVDRGAGLGMRQRRHHQAAQRRQRSGGGCPVRAKGGWQGSGHGRLSLCAGGGPIVVRALAVPQHRACPWHDSRHAPPRKPSMTRTAPGTEDTLQARARFFHDAFARWLAEPGVTIACGRWAEGAISEIMPMGRATLLPGVYDDCFSGIREVRLDGQPHHLHIDFGRVHAFSYAIAPSVCMAFKPSFEVRLLVIGPGGLPSDRWIVSLMLAAPYKDGVLDHPAIVAFFQRAQRDAAERPDLVAAAFLRFE